MDPYSHATRTKALAQLAAAFDMVRLEDGVSLHEADAIDDYAGKEERAAARALDGDVAWMDVPSSELERMYWVWSYFDAKGFRCYLPAALRWWMGEFSNPDSNSTTISCVLYAFQRPTAFQSITDEQMRLLTPEQLAAIQSCLDWIAEHDKAIHNKARRAAKSVRQMLSR